MESSGPATSVAALSLLRAGVSFLAIRADGTKAPAVGSWKQYQKRLPTADDAHRWFSGRPLGLAAIGGEVSGGLECIDFDAGDLYEPWCELVEEACPGVIERLTVVRTPREPHGFHVWYRCPDHIEGNTVLARASDGDRKALIETRGEGGYALVPGGHPSAHETGRPYEYLAGTLEEVAELTAEERETLFDCARYFDQPKEESPAPEYTSSPPGEGLKPGEDFERLATWESILAPLGWTVAGRSGEEVRWARPGKSRGWSATTGRCRGRDGHDLLHVFSSSASPFEMGKTYGKFRAYALLSHGGNLSEAAKELRSKGYGSQTPHTGKSRQSPDPEEVEDLVYRPFPTGRLPQPFRDFVRAGAAAIGCDEGFFALPLLVSAGAAVGNARRLQIKQAWRVPPILWAGIIGLSGAKKTVVLDAALEPSKHKDSMSQAAHREELKRFKVEHTLWKKRLHAWERDKGESEPPPEPERPQTARYVVSDATVEALAPLLRASPKGLLLERDELAGWVGAFDKYSKAGKGGGDAANWLPLYNGKSLTIDRKTGDDRTIHVPMASVSIIGGIQPEILKRVLTREHMESGMAARLLLVFPPPRVMSWTEHDIDITERKRLVDVFDGLFELLPDYGDDGIPKPLNVQLDASAKELWIDFYNRHAVEQAAACGDIGAALSKLEELPARLALIIHCVRVAAGERIHAFRVDAETMLAAIALTQWFKRETRRVYSILAESEEGAEQRRLLEWIARKGGEVTPREAQRSFSHLAGAGAAEQALDALVKAGLGVWATIPPGPKGGRPTKAFALSRTPNTSEAGTPTPPPSPPPAAKDTESGDGWVIVGDDEDEKEGGSGGMLEGQPDAGPYGEGF